MLVFDTHTLIVVFVVVNVLVGALMLIAFHGRMTPVLRYWIASLFIYGLGWGLLNECGGALALLGFASLTVAAGLMLSALTKYFNIPERYGWPWWPVAIGLLFCALVPDSPWLRQIGGGLIAAVQVLMSAAVLFWALPAQKKGLVRILMCSGGVLAAGMLLVRAYALYRNGSAQCLIENETMAQGIMFLAFFVFRLIFIFGFLLLIEDRQRESVTRLASLDPLTEAYNRRTFNELAECELSRLRRRGHDISLLTFDLDHFKLVNDRYGHQAGDAVLRLVKYVADQCLRREDLLARYGGEEFVVLLPETGADGARKLAERLRQAIAAQSFDHQIGVTISIGIASMNAAAGECTLDVLLAQADQAMYMAKAAGRDCTVDAEMLAAARARLAAASATDA